MSLHRFALLTFMAAGLAMTGLAMAVIAMTGPTGAASSDHRVVVELYTSQSCSDCPPADRLVEELAERDDVIVLSFHITYWDMLGWKDTLAEEASTRRQQAYARARNRRGTYTPQMIVGGVEDVVGNQRDTVLAAIRNHAAKSEGMEPVSILVTRTGREIEIAVSGTLEHISATVWVMRTLSHARVAIHGGENNGSEIVYTNIVRDLRNAGTWEGGDQKFSLPVLRTFKDYDGIAVVVQSGGYGPVLGATLLDLPEDSAP